MEDNKIAIQDYAIDEENFKKIEQSFEFSIEPYNEAVDLSDESRFMQWEMTTSDRL